MHLIDTALSWLNNNFAWFYYAISIICFILSLYFFIARKNTYSLVWALYLVAALIFAQQILLIFESFFRSFEHQDSRWVLGIIYFGGCYILNVVTIILVIKNVYKTAK
jgi:hypothetical protein